MPQLQCRQSNSSIFVFVNFLVQLTRVYQLMEGARQRPTHKCPCLTSNCSATYLPNGHFARGPLRPGPFLHVTLSWFPQRRLLTSLKQIISNIGVTYIASSTHFHTSHRILARSQPHHASFLSRWGKYRLLYVSA